MGEQKAPQWTYPLWTYGEATFYFCAPGCEEEVKADPEKWLAMAKSGSHGHGHSH